MHGNAVAFEAVIADLKRQSPDAIVCLGDIALRGPQPQECVEMLRSLNPLVTVRGNYDDQFTRWPHQYSFYDPTEFKHQLVDRTVAYGEAWLKPADQEWLANLPVIHTMTIEGVQVELFHASPRSLVEINLPWVSLDDLCKLRADEKTRLVVYGHIHHAFARQARGVQVVNPGSAGLAFDYDNRASYAIIDLEAGSMAVQLRRVAYDVEAVIEIARQRAMPDLEAFSFGVRHARYPYNGPIGG